MSSIGIIRLSHLIALRRDLDKLANNVANISTAGFKRQRSSFKEHLKQANQSGPQPNANKYVSLVDTGFATTDFSQGQIEHTGNPLDVAINGDGWFVVQTPNGNRYTRDGSLRLNGLGQLITAGGHPILTSSGTLAFSSSDRNIAIASDGTISTAQGNRGRIMIVNFQNQSDLSPVGNNLFVSDNKPSAIGGILSVAAIEKSNVISMNEITNLIRLTRTYEMTANMMKKDGNSTELQRLSDTL